ncbi:MAG: class I SAM-dependent methyltransferase [Planctomycetes bacterium]|nr:class I SAM-dependent methyltransferase [Planctomycetota bacterium]
MHSAEYARMASVEDRHWWFRGRLASVRALLKRYVPPGRGLDCSCGTGMTLSRVAPWVQAGADLSSLALQHARARGHKSLMQADLTRLPLRDSSLDLVTCLDTLEHVPDDAAALSEISRVLVPGGHALFTVPAHPWMFSAHDRALHHVRRYTYFELRGKVQAAGFNIRRFSWLNCLLLPPVAVVRLLRPDRGETASDTEKVPFSPLNLLLYLLFAAESLPLRFIGLPFGVSLICLARKA